MKYPQPRDNLYDIYWEFAAKRQAIFYARLNGRTEPWSDDPILQQYKFCNVFRAADRVSQYLIREVCYSDERRTPGDALFQIVTFRTFSKIETWEGLRRLLGRSPTLEDLSSGKFEQALVDLKMTHRPIYTNAFILCANDAFGRGEKVLNHVALFKHMFFDADITTRILNAATLEEVYGVLHSFPLYGDFMSYQTAVDINYSELINFSENDFTVAGPGALRGLKKVFEDLGDLTPEQAIHWMVDRQDAEFSRLNLPFDGLFGRKIHAIDAQNLFCEVDKYLRVYVPELASARTRIKTKFSPNHTNIKLFFPPKWGVNEKIPFVALTEQP